MIVGWCLINTVIKTDLYIELQKKINDFKNSGIFERSDRIVFGQILLSENFRNKGVATKMILLRDNFIAHRYDLHMATVKKDNKISEMFF